jgi:hypothetical protein
MCWEHTVTHTVFRSGAFIISLREGTTALPPNVQCAGNAIAGPFYATVHLPESYHGQPLVDAATGETHPPHAVVKLASAPKRLR